MEIKSLDGPSDFLAVLGDTPRNRILDSMLGEIPLDFTLKEIARKSDVSYAPVKRIWPHILKSGWVRPTRKVAKTTFYTYDLTNKAAKAIEQCYLKIITDVTEREASLQVPPIDSKK